MEDERPDNNETQAQRERYDEAQTDYSAQRARTRIAKAANTFQYTAIQFHDLEQEFLAQVDELRRTDVDQLKNLSHLEGMRIRLITSLDREYRHAVNELADAMLDSIGQTPTKRSEDKA